MHTARALVEQALAEVVSLEVAEALPHLHEAGTVFVDLREDDERQREGEIPGAVAVPRGLLEFRADPESPWHDARLAPPARLLLFCAAGWRSALAAEALQRMGRTGVAHLKDGFGAWVAAGGPVIGGAAPVEAPVETSSRPTPAVLDLPQALRIQAHANRLANLRLHTALASLDDEALHARRTNFFPSLMGTLNHILMVDAYYITALCGGPLDSGHWDAWRVAPDLPALTARQRLLDAQLVAFTDTLDAAACARPVDLPRAASHVQRDRVAHVLAHLFMHQTHHRGQVHAMMAGTPVAPPQLDEFLMSSEAHLREAEMAALGLDEAEVWRLRPPRP
jgi:uncharacterized damage-inducible protein DinB/rhodanese-related sulfurtransferase